MRKSFAFLVLIVIMAAVNCTKSSNTANNKTPPPSKACEKPVVYNCNLNQADVREAIKKMEAKLENLIALVNKTSPPQPKPPGIKSDKKYSFVSFALSAFSLVENDQSYLFTAVLASSCKEQYEKYK